MNRQKVAKEAIANFDKVHPNSSLEAKNFYIAGWLDGLKEFVSLVKQMRDAQKEIANYGGMLSLKAKQLESEVDEYLQKIEE